MNGKELCSLDKRFLPLEFLNCDTEFQSHTPTKQINPGKERTNTEKVLKESALAEKGRRKQVLTPFTVNGSSKLWKLRPIHIRWNTNEIDYGLRNY